MNMEETVGFLAQTFTKKELNKLVIWLDDAVDFIEKEPIGPVATCMSAKYKLKMVREHSILDIPSSLGVSSRGHGDYATKETGNVYLIIDRLGETKIEVIKEIRSFTGYGLKEISDKINSLPAIFRVDCELWEAEKFAGVLETLGANCLIR